MNLVAGMVRMKPISEALEILKLTPKKGAKILYKVVHSAGHNAQNNFKQNLETLMVKEIIVTEGPTYKRFRPISRGRSHPLLKRTSHVTVKVEVDPELTKPMTESKPKAEKSKKESPKKAEKKTENSSK